MVGVALCVLRTTQLVYTTARVKALGLSSLDSHPGKRQTALQNQTFNLRTPSNSKQLFGERFLRLGSSSGHEGPLSSPAPAHSID